MKAIIAIVLIATAVLCASALAQEKTADDWLKEGFSLAANGSYEQALEAYDKSIQIDPNNELAWINKANVFLILNKTNDAIASYQKALYITNQTREADPKNATLWSTKGLLLHNVGNYEESVRAFDNATNVDPNYEMAWKMKGVILASELGRNEEAVDAFDRALAINPDDPRTWQAKGDALKALGRQSEADEAYAKAKELGVGNQE